MCDSIELRSDQLCDCRRKILHNAMMGNFGVKLTFLDEP